MKGILEMLEQLLKLAVLIAAAILAKSVRLS